MSRFLVGFSLLFILLLFFGCAGIERYGTNAGIGSNPVYKTGAIGVPAPGNTYLTTTSEALNSPSVQNIQNKMIIKTGTAQIEVLAGTIKDKYNQLGNVITRYNGEITDSSYTETESEKYYYLTVKLSPNQFDDFTKEISAIGTLKSLASNSEDITTQYIDISAKLDNLNASRNRILSLYNKADKISDVLALEQELNRLQYQIDSAAGQKLYYERQSTKATLTIKLYESVPAVDKKILDPLKDLANIFLGGLTAALLLIAGLAGFGIPVLVVLGFIYLIIKKLFFKNKKQEKFSEKKS